MSDVASSTSRAGQLQTIEGALQVALTAVERLAPTERHRRSNEALTRLHAEVLDTYLRVSTGDSRTD